jgi:hypothetical protein
VADIWKEVYKPKRKGLLTPCPGLKCIWEYPAPPTLPHTLLPQEVWYVRVCSFTFVFHTPQQLEECVNYYCNRIHSSSRIPGRDLVRYGGDTWERLRWYERLPMYLLEEPKRKKVVAALRLAVRQWTKALGRPIHRAVRQARP